ncbi:MAG: hypothetical protein IKU43_05590 [Clostridia bacterium]|nr:hypothetical protein [Clostridia bacterium]
MIVFLVFSAIFAVTLLSVLLNKSCSNILANKGSAGKAVYVLVTGIFACINFWAFSGCTLEINWNCIYLSFFYAICSFLSGISIIVYKYADIATVNVTKSSLSLLFSTLVGFIIFDESPSVSKLVRIALMLVAVFCIFLDGREQLKRSGNDGSTVVDKKHGILMFILINAMLIPVYCFGAYQNKIVASTDFVPDMNSYFFMTNVFMILFTLVWIAFLAKKDKNNVTQCISLVKSKSILPMIVLVFFGSLAAVLAVIILKYMEVSVYSPINSALSFICAALSSVIFREKIGKFVWCSVALAIFAVVFEPVVSLII